MARTFVRASNQLLAVASAPVTAVPLTLSIWANSSTVSIFQENFAVDVGAAGDDGFWLGTDNPAANPMRAATNDGTYRFSGAATRPTDGSWFFTAGRYSAVNSRFVWVDQTESTEGTDSATPTGIDSVSIGARLGQIAGGVNNWDGDLAEAAIWNVGLNDEELIALAKGYSPLFIRPQNLVFYCPIWGNDSPEIDIIGGLQLTLDGSPAKSDHPPIIYPSTIQIPLRLPDGIAYTSPFPAFRAP